MSRFKKLNRIEDAIKHRNKPELEWALAYAQDRFNTSTMKQHEKEWRAVVKRIEEAIHASPNENTQAGAPANTASVTYKPVYGHLAVIDRRP